MTDDDIFDRIPDVRDGLLRKERIILYCLGQARKELGGRNVPTIMLYGRVSEFIEISQKEFQHILSHLTGLTRDTHLPPCSSAPAPNGSS